MENHSEDWKEYRRLVLSELKRLNEQMENVKQALSKVQSEIETLKVKAGIWGAIGACIPIIAYILLNLKQ